MKICVIGLNALSGASASLEAPHGIIFCNLWSAEKRSID